MFSVDPHPKLVPSNVFASKLVGGFLKRRMTTPIKTNHMDRLVPSLGGSEVTGIFVDNAKALKSADEDLRGICPGGEILQPIGLGKK